MPRTLSRAKTPYDILLIQVRNTLIEGQQRIEEERVRTYWETGRHINKHILKYSKRAEYGGQVIKRLVQDLKVDDTTLRQCVQFAKTYPTFPIYRRGGQFKWRHFRKLITISDDKRRKRLEDEIAHNAWTSDELIAYIQSQKTTLNLPLPSGERVRVRGNKPLTSLRGELFTYKIVARPTLGGEEGLLLDLGFGIFRNLDNHVISQFKEGDIVQSRPKEDAYKFTKKDNGTDKDLYTYQAYIEKVLDGDTLKVRFDLGFDTWMRETLRLRGLDCPELSTKEGAAAKTFVASYIKEADRVIVRSTRDDKYGRYLADVFLPSSSEPLRGASEGSDAAIYLNNLLLEKGYAIRM